MTVTPPAGTPSTPIYHMYYLAEGQPVRDTRVVLQANAETIEASLAAGGIAPPGAADLAALAGRVTTVENKVKTTATSTLALASSASTAGFTIGAGGAQYVLSGNVCYWSVDFRRNGAIANNQLLTTFPVAPPFTMFYDALTFGTSGSYSVDARFEIRISTTGQLLTSRAWTTNVAGAGFVASGAFPVKP